MPNIPQETRGRKKDTKVAFIRRLIKNGHRFSDIADKAMARFNFSHRDVAVYMIDFMAVKLLLLRGKKKNYILKYMRLRSETEWDRNRLNTILLKLKPYTGHLVGQGFLTEMRIAETPIIDVDSSVEQIVATETPNMYVSRLGRPIPNARGRGRPSGSNHINTNFDTFITELDYLRNMNFTDKSNEFIAFRNMWYPNLYLKLVAKLSSVPSKEGDVDSYINEEMWLFFTYINVDTSIPRKTMAYIAFLLNTRVTRHSFREWLSNDHQIGALNDIERNFRIARKKWWQKTSNEWPNLITPKEITEFSKLMHTTPKCVLTYIETKDNEIKSLSDKLGNSKNDTGTLQDVLPDTKAENEFEQIAFNHDVLKALDVLPDLQRKMVMMAYGFDGDTPISIDTIGENFKCSTKQVKEFLDDAMKKMRGALVVT